MHLREAGGHDQGIVDPQRVGGVFLAGRHQDLLITGKASIPGQRLSHQQRLPAQEIDAGFQVQPGAHRHGFPGVAVFFQDGAQLLGASLVGALRQADEEMLAHHHHVPAIHGARSLDALCRAEAGQQRRDAVFLAAAGLCAGAGDGRHPGRDDGGIFGEIGIRVARLGRQHGHLQSQAAQRLNVGGVLLQDESVAGAAQGGGGQPVGEVFAGQAGNGVVEHGGSSLSNRMDRIQLYRKVRRFGEGRRTGRQD